MVGTADAHVSLPAQLDGDSQLMALCGLAYTGGEHDQAHRDVDPEG